jgi:1-acyl-sn-glycerol-3-phosphate acyltransferase
MASLGGGLKALRGGMNIFVFPEGGRTPNGEMREFLLGSAYLAIRAKVPIVPMALVGLHDLLPIHTRHFYPCRLALRVGEPIDTSEYSLKEIDQLNDQLKKVIEELLTKE